MTNTVSYKRFVDSLAQPDRDRIRSALAEMSASASSEFGVVVGLRNLKEQAAQLLRVRESVSQEIAFLNERIADQDLMISKVDDFLGSEDYSPEAVLMRQTALSQKGLLEEQRDALDLSGIDASIADLDAKIATAAENGKAALRLLDFSDGSFRASVSLSADSFEKGETVEVSVQSDDPIRSVAVSLVFFDPDNRIVPAEDATVNETGGLVRVAVPEDVEAPFGRAKVVLVDEQGRSNTIFLDFAVSQG